MKIFYFLFLSLILISCSKKNIEEEQKKINIKRSNRSSILLAPISACSNLSVTENTVFNCNQTNNAGDLWYFGDLHTCDWLYIEQDLGQITGTPNHQDIGTCILDIRVIDADPVIKDEQFTITVTNAAPTLSISEKTITEDDPINIVFSNSDVESNEEINKTGIYTLNSSSVSSSPLCEDVGELILDSENGEISFKPNPNINGSCYIGINFSDNQGAANSIVFAETSISITAVNDAPELKLSNLSDIQQDELVSFNSLGTDVDGDTLTYNLGSSHDCSWLNIESSTGVLSGQPNDNQVGAYTIAVMASDGTLSSSEVSHTIKVFNKKPELTITDVTGVPVGSAAITIKADADVQSNEEGFGTYSFEETNTPNPKCLNHGVLSIDSNTGEITYDPDDAYEGTCNIGVIFNDQNTENNNVLEIFSVQVGNGFSLSPIKITSISKYINQNNQKEFKISGNCEFVRESVQIKIYNMKASTLCKDNKTYNFTLDLSSLPESNNISVEVGQFDLSKNFQKESLFINKDTIARDEMAFSIDSSNEEIGFNSSFNLEISNLPPDLKEVHIYSDSLCKNKINTKKVFYDEKTHTLREKLFSQKICSTHKYYAKYSDLAGNESECSKRFQTYYLFGYKRNLTLSNMLDKDEIFEIEFNESNFSFINEDVGGFYFKDNHGNSLDFAIYKKNKESLSFRLAAKEKNTNRLEIYYCQPDLNNSTDDLMEFKFLKPHYQIGVEEDI